MKASGYSHLFGYNTIQNIYIYIYFYYSAESVLNQSVLKLFTFSYIKNVNKNPTNIIDVQHLNYILINTYFF